MVGIKFINMKMQRSYIKERNFSNFSHDKFVKTYHAGQLSTHPIREKKKNSKASIQIHKGNFATRKGPLQIGYDKETLYEENLKLKQKLRSFEEEIIKIKTKAKIAEKQKQQVIDVCMDEKQLYYNSKSSFKRNQIMRKAFRETKNEMEILIAQNNRLKKCAKYTQLNELKIQNERLQEELRRMREYVKLFIENETYENAIETQKTNFQNKIQELEAALLRKHDESLKLKEKVNELQKKKEKRVSIKKHLIKSHEKEVENESIQKSRYCQHCEELERKTHKLEEELREKEQLMLQIQQISMNKQESMKKEDRQSVNSITSKLKMDQNYHADELLSLRNDDEQFNEKEIDLLKDEDKSLEEEEEKQQQQSGEEHHKIITQTVTYKFMAQRYTFNDFQKDIEETAISEFTFKDIKMILGSEPFYLTQDQIEHLLIRKFRFADSDQKISKEQFLGKIRDFVLDFELVSEKEEEDLLKELIEQINREMKELLRAFRKVEGGSKVITKYDFIHVLKYIGKLTDRKIDLCLGEICLVSVDINHLDYTNFLRKFAYDKQVI